MNPKTAGVPRRGKEYAHKQVYFWGFGVMSTICLLCYYLFQPCIFLIHTETGVKPVLYICIRHSFICKALNS